MTPETTPRVLVADDDDELLLVIQEMLEDARYHVIPTSNLSSSLAALEEHLFDLVLTDLFASKGQPTLHSIQPLIQKAAPTPVGLLTGWNIPQDALAQANLAFVLHKPFEIDDLLGQIDTHTHSQVRRARQHKLVQEFLQAFNARDWARIERLCALDLMGTQPLTTGTLSLQRPGYLGSLMQRASTWPDYTIADARCFERVDGLAVRYQARWIDNTGIAHQVAGSLRFRFQQGRIAQIDGAF